MKKVLAGFWVGIFFVTAFLFIIKTEGSENDLGKKLYADKCKICHGIKGDGKGAAAAYLNSQPADFTDPKFWEKHDNKNIADSIENGKGEMPAFALKPDEMKALIDYMTHTFTPRTK